MLENLKNLCELNGISGDEGSVRDYIINQLDGKAEYKIDNLGNIVGQQLWSLARINAVSKDVLIRQRFQFSFQRLVNQRFIYTRF